jgi:hypothetical protein
MWYRHLTATIDSAMDWLSGSYKAGFGDLDAIAAANSVHAQASLWLENTAAIVNFQRQYPERCCAMRYEDFSADMQAAADPVYRFLEVAPVPDGRQGALRRERQGQAGGTGDILPHESPPTLRMGGRCGPTSSTSKTCARSSGLCHALGYLAPDGN